MIVYARSSIYITDAKNIHQKIHRMEQLICALELMALDMATLPANDQGITTFSLASYKIDDGQSKVEQVFQSATQVANAILIYRRLMNIYINSLNGRSRRLVDSKNAQPWNHLGGGFRF